MKRILTLFAVLSTFKLFAFVDIQHSTLITNYPSVCDPQVYAKVEFKVTAEVNNFVFAVQRSLQYDFSGTVVLVAQINGCGTCVNESYSTPVDYGPFIPGEKWYFRIKAISNFGVTTYHTVDDWTVPLIPADWTSQVNLQFSNANSPNTESSYTWSHVPLEIQGVSINLHPTEVVKIYVEQSNHIINFDLTGSPTLFQLVDVKVDNGSSINVYTGGPTKSAIWSTSSMHLNTIGHHTLNVTFVTEASSIITRTYNVYVVPKSDGFYIDNYCNTIRVWKGSNPTAGAPLILSEGFDAYNTKSQQYYREAGKDLIEALHNNCYNIYIVNYAFNSQSLKNNAAVFQSATRYVSSINNNKLVVAAGMSLGGVVCRYACAHAESVGNPLPISEFVSLDAPQQGAIIDHALQNYRMNQTSSADGYARHASNNDAAKELLMYNSYDLGSITHLNFFADLNSLNGDGYPHLVPCIGVAFSNSAPNPQSGVWLYVHVQDIPGNHNATFSLGSYEQVAGSYLPKLNVDPRTVSVPFYTNAILGSPASFFVNPRVSIVQYKYPTFIPHTSALDLVNGTSKFDISIWSSITYFHDEVPAQIITPLINALGSACPLPITTGPGKADLNLISKTCNSISLQYYTQASANQPTSYKIYYSGTTPTNGIGLDQGPSPIVISALTNNTTLTWSTPHTDLTFYIVGVNSAGQGPTSDIIEHNSYDITGSSSFQISNILIESGNNYWNNKAGAINVQEDLTISNGADVTVKDMDLRFGKNGRLIIESGGSLTIDNGTVGPYNDCGTNCKWKGIEVKSGGTLTIKGAGTLELNTPGSFIRPGAILNIENGATIALNNNNTFPNPYGELTIEIPVTLSSGKTLNVTSGDTPFGGHLAFTGGLTLNNNSILKNENCHLRIENNSSSSLLTYNQGAEIELQTSTSDLTFNTGGELNIPNNTSFNFTGNGEMILSGGKIKMNNSLSNINMNGKPGTISVSYAPTEIKGITAGFNNCVLNYNTGGSLYSTQTAVNFYNCTFQGTNTGYSANVYGFNGSDNASILMNSCTVNGFKTGLQMTNIAANPTISIDNIKLSNTSFNNCQTAVNLFDNPSKVNLTNVDITNDWLTNHNGIVADEYNNIVLNNCDISNCYLGVKISAGSCLYMYGGKIHDNYTGISGKDVCVYLRDNAEVSSNSYGIGIDGSVVPEDLPYPARYTSMLTIGDIGCARVINNTVKGISGDDFLLRIDAAVHSQHRPDHAIYSNRFDGNTMVFDICYTETLFQIPILATYNFWGVDVNGVTRDILSPEYKINACGANTFHPGQAIGLNTTNPPVEMPDDCYPMYIDGSAISYSRSDIIRFGQEYPLSDEFLIAYSFFIERDDEETRDRFTDMAAIRLHRNDEENWMDDHDQIYDNTGVQLIRTAQIITNAFSPEARSVVSTEENNTASQNGQSNIIVVPNPNNGNFTIDLPLSDTPTTIIVFDVMGKKVYETSATSKTAQVNLNYAAKGMYTVQVTNGTKRQNIKMLVE